GSPRVPEKNARIPRRPEFFFARVCKAAQGGHLAYLAALEKRLGFPGFRPSSPRSPLTHTPPRNYTKYHTSHPRTAHLFQEPLLRAHHLHRLELPLLHRRDRQRLERRVAVRVEAPLAQDTLVEVLRADHRLADRFAVLLANHAECFEHHSGGLVAVHRVR